MALPKSYLTTVKNLSGIFSAIRSAQAPQKFTIKFLESLEFKSQADRLIVGVLKSLGFLEGDGKPKERYYRYLDQSQSEVILADGIREAYADLFQVKVTANSLSKKDVINKFKTLSQGQYSESVLIKMAMTFTSLCKLADFKTKPSVETVPPSEHAEIEEVQPAVPTPSAGVSYKLGGLHYNIQIILPESRDPKVYDVLFRSLKEHLF